MSPKKVGSLGVGELCAEFYLGTDSLWALLTNDEGVGLALRCAWAPGAPLKLERSEGGEFTVNSAFGTYKISVSAPCSQDATLRVTTRLIPDCDLQVAAWPRDLYPLGIGADPTLGKGQVIAAQRGLNSGLLYGRLGDEETGHTFFYFQDFTSLNPFFRATGTKPDGAVGGSWPELGYQPPSVCESPLKAGVEMVLSDAYLRIDGAVPNDKQSEARSFLDHQAAIYPSLAHPELGFRDWPAKAAETLKGLIESPLVTVEDGSYRYVRAYVDGGCPDSMAQLTVLGMLDEYARWKGEELQIQKDLRAGVYRFFDPERSAITRFVSTMKPADDEGEVDSWYLYHPLKGLARLAKSGDAGALDLFLSSMEFAIHVAQHFEYTWPIKFILESLQITTPESSPGRLGQTDAGGIYAYVMMDAFDLTGEKKFLDEAARAIRATKHLGFDIVYQTNLTSWGAAACLRIWRETQDEFFREQALPFLASFFHNCSIWDSKIGKVDMPNTFLGVTCLHDGPYMAPFECYESYCAFIECLTLADGVEAFPDSARLLMSEFCRYALERAWWFYPDTLPETAIAHSPQTGKIVRSLAFPVEDIYVDGRPAGEIGQEVYGCGASFAYATRAFHRLPGDRMLFCEYPLGEIEISEKGVKFRLLGPAGGECDAQVLPPDGCSMKLGSERVDAQRFKIKVGEKATLSWK